MFLCCFKIEVQFWSIGHKDARMIDCKTKLKTPFEHKKGKNEEEIYFSTAKKSMEQKCLLNACSSCCSCFRSSYLSIGSESKQY